MADDKDKLNKLRQKVWDKLVGELKFKEIQVPDDGNPQPNTSILVSANLETARNGK